jgi:hypothetical protein
VDAQEWTWAGLRSWYRKQHVCSRTSSICVSRLKEREEELTFEPACKREEENKWGGRLGCCPFCPCRGRGSDRGGVRPDLVALEHLHQFPNITPPINW